MMMNKLDEIVGVLHIFGAVALFINGHNVLGVLFIVKGILDLIKAVKQRKGESNTR